MTSSACRSPLPPGRAASTASRTSPTRSDCSATRRCSAEAGLDAAPTTWDELVAAGSTIADLDAPAVRLLHPRRQLLGTALHLGLGWSALRGRRGWHRHGAHQQPRVRRGLELPQGQHPRHGRSCRFVELPRRLRQHDHRLQGRHHHVRHERSLAGRRPPGRRGLRRPVEPRHRPPPRGHGRQYRLAGGWPQLRRVRAGGQ